MKNSSEENVASVADILAADKDGAAAPPLLAKMPTCLFIASAMSYFLLSEGIGNYLSFLRHTVVQVIGQVK
ncbi:hypothetical protein [Massilia niastensis]|uniref:hypothetical protein n=1 Tax=Massilia niastensis TaxID=544911 RepID=UPI000369E796|nr:hypothetical protein [Massilia niastensis]